MVEKHLNISSKFKTLNRHDSIKGKKCIAKRAQDIFGGNLMFYIICHGFSSNCKEYVISKEAFSFKRWFLFMTLFSVLAFYSELHNKDISILGVICFLLCIILVIKLHLKVKEESLLIIASLGLQLTTTFVTGRRASQFIQQQHIQDIVINEGITMHRVLYYLAVLLKDANKPFGIGTIIPLFQNTFPRVDCLERIYEGIELTINPEDTNN